MFFCSNFLQVTLNPRVMKTKKLQLRNLSRLGHADLVDLAIVAYVMNPHSITQ